MARIRVIQRERWLKMTEQERRDELEDLAWKSGGSGAVIVRGETRIENLCRRWRAWRDRVV